MYITGDEMVKQSQIWGNFSLLDHMMILKLS